MHAHTTQGLQLHRREAGRLAIPALVRTGAIAGLVGGMVMAMWQMIVGAIAQQPTAVPAIDTSFWTAITAIPSVPFGLDWFHGSFELGAVLVGLIGHMINAMMLGALGVALLAIVLGSRPSIAKAIASGMMFGLLLEVVVVNLIVHQIQAVDTLYTSTPQGSWWVAHAMYGAALGLVAARLLRRRDA